MLRTEKLALAFPEASAKLSGWTSKIRPTQVDPRSNGRTSTTDRQREVLRWNCARVTYVNRVASRGRYVDQHLFGVVHMVGGRAHRRVSGIRGIEGSNKGDILLYLQKVECPLFFHQRSKPFTAKSGHGRGTEMPPKTSPDFKPPYIESDYLRRRQPRAPFPRPGMCRTCPTP